MMGRRWSDVVRAGRVSLVGSIDYRVEFACQVRSFILNEKPDLVCVEAPVALREQIVTAVRRLPYHSVIIYGNENDQYTGLIIDGSDGIIEAVRSATEENIPVWFLDPTVRNRHGSSEKLPDAYSIDQIGQKTFLESIVGLSMADRPDPDHPNRELFIAARLQEASRSFERILFVGNFRTVNRLANILEEPHAIPLMKPEIAKSAVVAPLHPDTLKKGIYRYPEDHGSVRGLAAGYGNRFSAGSTRTDRKLDGRGDWVLCEADTAGNSRICETDMGQVLA